jgi:hypothetical protein
MDAPDRADPLLEGIVGGGLGGDGWGLGHPVTDGHLVHVHLVDHPAHHLDRAGRSGHDPGAQRGEVEVAELGMVELGDEHRRHSVEGGAALGGDRRQARAPVEGRRRDTVQEPWVSAARLPITMPKQW